jgi:hypothetical protein
VVGQGALQAGHTVIIIYMYQRWMLVSRQRSLEWSRGSQVAAGPLEPMEGEPDLLGLEPVVASEVLEAELRSSRGSRGEAGLNGSGIDRG